MCGYRGRPGGRAAQGEMLPDREPTPAEVHAQRGEPPPTRTGRQSRCEQAEGQGRWPRQVDGAHVRTCKRPGWQGRPRCMAKMRPEQEGPQGSQLSSAGRLRAGEAVCAHACMIGVVFLVILFLDCWLLCGGEFGRSRAWQRSGEGGSIMPLQGLLF